MTLADPKTGGWILKEQLTHVQMNAIRTELLKAVDGTGGGTYTLTAPLIFGGDTLRVTDELHVASGATLNVDGVSDFSDPATFSDDVNLNGDVVFGAAGSTTFTLGNDVVFGSLLDIDGDGLEHLYRHPLVPWGITILGGEPTWQTGTPAGGALWINTNSNSLSLIYFQIPLMQGDELESIAITVEGGASSGHGGTDPTNKLRARFLEGASISGVPSSLASLEDPATGVSYDGVHTFFLDSSSHPGVFPYTALNRVYLLEFRAESGGTAADDENLIHAITANVTRNRFVSTNMFYA